MLLFVIKHRNLCIQHVNVCEILAANRKLKVKGPSMHAGTYTTYPCSNITKT